MSAIYVHVMSGPEDMFGCGCDFCDALATVVYPARPTETSSDLTNIHGQRLRTVLSFERADWRACDTCKTLIDGGRRVELAKRGTTNSLARHEDVLAPLTRPQRRDVVRQIKADTRRLHDDFWAARLGPARPLEEGRAA